MADPELKQQVEQLIAANPVLLFMKGTPDMPRCGFSMRVVQVLDQLDVEYGAIDVLPALQPLREVTAEISDWQTFPQLYVNGELRRRLPTSSRRCSSPASWPSRSASSSPRPSPRRPATEQRPPGRARRFRSTRTDWPPRRACCRRSAPGPLTLRPLDAAAAERLATVALGARRPRVVGQIDRVDASLATSC